MFTRRRWIPGPVSLKARFSLAVGMLIVLTATVLTVAAVLIVQRGIETVVGEREASLISQVARDLDNKFLIRQQALMRLAHDLEVRPHPSAAFQDRLEQYHSMDGFFTNMSVLDVQGEHVANMDYPDTRGQLNFSTRDYFLDTIRTDGPVISRPLRSQLSGRPVVIMTAPIHDKGGRISHILVGTIDLAKDSFIKELSIGQVGKTGYFYILSREGVFVSHPDERRILRSIDDGGKRAPSVDLALGGYEGTMRSAADSGADALVSYKRLASTGWLLCGVYPSAEAFAFANKMRWNAAIIAALLMLVIGPVAWFMIGRQLRPLKRLGARMAAGRGAVAQDAPYADDEIGELWRAFDTLMAERDQAERAVADSERNLRMVADNVPALVGYVDRNERFVFGNERYSTFFGISARQIPGKSVREVIGEALYKASKAYLDAALSGRAVQFERQVMRHGVPQWDRVAYNPDIDAAGVVQGYFVLVDDITELKATQQVLAMSEKRIRTIADNMPALIGYVDTEYRYTFCNRAYATITDIAPEQIVGRTVSDVFGPKVFAAVAAQMAAALAGRRVSFERPAAELKGERYLQTEYIPDIGADGKVAGFYTMVMDITERKAAELALSAQQRLLHTVTDNLPALVNFMDRDGRFGFVNRHHESWFGRPLARIHGSLVSSLFSPEEAEVHQRAFDEAMTGNTVKFDFARMQGNERRHYQATYIAQVDAAGNAVGVTGLVNDVTDSKLLEEQLSALARFDALTGLPNRTQLTERIGRAQTRSARNGNVMAVMYLDLDKFKSINDSFGHSGGDTVLVEFGRRLSACVRQSDTVGRLAGDEFVILLEGLQNVSECAVVARKIIKVMEKPFDIDGVARIVSTSIGVATAENGRAGVDTLLKHADDALYRAKDSGRNRYSMTSVK
ncbi:sensor domain-containing diguanylate cyclase [Massilia scottii]|uniref:sensor domain-containing diguanylate cyclase n=1 Tax=Massilia scottii TaxID=3057166 RepID=UPI0027968AAF|nr:PAS domain-containing protein [Massilia sp. CCM 9029]MDQ1833786.1 PAS domain-containing protein [Massilia sp. CCM 9029]